VATVAEVGQRHRSRFFDEFLEFERRARSDPIALVVERLDAPALSKAAEHCAAGT
jgi:hypothetical protein